MRNKKALAGIIFLALSVVSGIARAADNFSPRSLNGDYAYNLVDIHESPVGLQHCDQYGTMTFDGNGMAKATGVVRCNGSAPLSLYADFIYTVDPDGTALITKVGTAYPIHGRIVEHGRMILLDGSTRETAIYVQHGTAVRQ
jgi:hypothetical protein